MEKLLVKVSRDIEVTFATCSNKMLNSPEFTVQNGSLTKTRDHAAARLGSPHMEGALD